MGTGYEITKDETGDHVLKRGHVWITVGELSVRMEKYPEDGLHIEVYRKGEEDKDPLCSCSTGK